MSLLDTIAGVNTIEPVERQQRRRIIQVGVRGAPLPEDPASVKRVLYIQDRGRRRHYFSDYQQKNRIITASPQKISTIRTDANTVRAMLDLAEARGWREIRVSGSADFKREAWVQASIRGLTAIGYKPVATDEQEKQRRLAAAPSKPQQPSETARADQRQPSEPIVVAAAKQTASKRARASSNPATSPKQEAAQRQSNGRKYWGEMASAAPPPQEKQKQQQRQAQTASA